ncbi:MAG: hypothetical protein AAGD04_00500 [Pseudomonadota bacterium]
MPRRSRRSKRLKRLVAINYTLLLAAVLVSTLTVLVAKRPASLDSQVGLEAREMEKRSLQQEVDQKYADLLRKAKAAIDEKDHALRELRREIDTGYVVAKDIEVTDSSKALWLAEPNLMLGVQALAGGRIKVNFANRSPSISVGERIDFLFEGRACSLMLKSSVYGKAVFRFSCSSSTTLASASFQKTF